MTRPSLSSTIRSHSAAARFKSCVDTTIVVPRSALSRFKQRARFRTGSRGRATAVGSSSSSRSEACASALAITTRCFSPPLSVANDRDSSARCRSPRARRGRSQIARALELERAEMRIAAHQHHVEDGEVERRVRFLRRRPRCGARDRAGSSRRSAGRRARPRRTRRQRCRQIRRRSVRLAGAVRAEKADDRRRAGSSARRRRATSGAPPRRRAVGERHVTRVDHRPRS